MMDVAYVGEFVIYEADSVPGDTFIDVTEAYVGITEGQAKVNGVSNEEDEPVSVLGIIGSPNW